MSRNRSGQVWATVRKAMLGRLVRNYGFTEIVREHSGYPRYLPFPAYMEHGWYLRSEPRESDLRARLNAMLVFNRRGARAWAKASPIPVAVMGAPFVHYRRMAGIEIRSDARGLVAFPAHSGTELIVEYDIGTYCRELKRAGVDFGPVTVCLHWDDIRRGRGKEYEKHGLAVATAGPRHAADFPRRFYDILASHRFATSNGLGTALLYSVELGLPFFLLGERVKVVNPEVGAGSASTDAGRQLIARVRELFASPVQEVSAEQAAFVESEAGLRDCLSGPELRAFLLRALFRRALPQVPARAARAISSRISRA